MTPAGAFSAGPAEALPRVIVRHPASRLVPLWGKSPIRRVAPSESAVLDNTRVEGFALVSGYPFYFVGAAPECFVVRAERVS